MKKCASCIKDLPEAALHCVFCGAKQPLAPAVRPGVAKTAFGYSNELAPRPPTTAQSPAPPMPPIRPSPQKLVAPPPPPVAMGNAATLFADNNRQPHTPDPALQATLAAPPQQGPPTRPSVPLRPSAPSQVPPILGMPVNGYPAPSSAQPPPSVVTLSDPWRDSLSLVMIVWGLLVIAALATPRSLDPPVFSWDVLLHGEGMARLPFLVDAALGVLGLAVALLPMPTTARGVLAALLGLAALAVPIVLDDGAREWRQLVALGSVVLIVPALLLRSVHTNALLPRIVVTLSVIAFVLLFLVPANGGIPLVTTIKTLMDAPGQAKLEPIVQLARLAIVVLTLLVWMPGPATAGGTMFAWLIMLVIGGGFALIELVRMLALAGHPLDIVAKTPGSLGVWVLPTACLAFVGYGLAAVIGKRLE